MSTQPDALATLESVKPKISETLQKIIDGAVPQAESLVIENDEQYQIAYETRKTFKSHQLMFDEGADVGIRFLYQAHKDAVAVRKKVDTQLELADSIIERKRIEYKKRVDQFDREKADRDRAALKQENDSAALEHGARLEASGESEAAQVVIERAIATPAPPVQVQNSATKSKGQINKKSYKWTVTDEGLIPDIFWMRVINEKSITAHVNSLGMKANVPGIDVTEHEKESVRLG